ncbi:MAG: n-acetylglutamate synthase [Pyrinomonadaceae bacterium]
MPDINYHDRHFAPVNNSESGEVSGATRFHYRQRGEHLVWATYEGGEILFGTLVANVIEGGALDMRYQHVNRRGELMTGRCRSTPEVLADGRLRLHESWQWTCGDQSAGTSVLEEIKLTGD